MTQNNCLFTNSMLHYPLKRGQCARYIQISIKKLLKISQMEYFQMNTLIHKKPFYHHARKQSRTCVTFLSFFSEASSKAFEVVKGFFEPRTLSLLFHPNCRLTLHLLSKPSMKGCKCLKEGST